MPKPRSAAAMAPPQGVVAPSKRNRLAHLLEPGERILWTGGPDTRSLLRTQIALWWVGVPLTVLALALTAFDLISDEWSRCLLIAGGVFLAAPFLRVFQGGGTIYAITDRRAIIKRDALGQKQSASVPFEIMDETLEIMDTAKGVGHLYFASKMSTKLCDVDFDGKLAFRELGRVQEVAALLDSARERWKRQQ